MMPTGTGGLAGLPADGDKGGDGACRRLFGTARGRAARRLFPQALGARAAAARAPPRGSCL